LQPDGKILNDLAELSAYESELGMCVDYVAFPVDTRQDGRPAVRWLDSVEDVKAVAFRNYRRKSKDRNQWRAILKEAN
jgi:hypothetical protein